MKKTAYLLVILLLISTSISAYLSVSLLREKQTIVNLKKEAALHTDALKQNKIYITSLQAEQQQKLKGVIDEIRTEQSTASASISNIQGIYIASTSIPVSQGKQTVVFWVKGPENALFDAMDLALTFSNIKIEPTCSTGKALAQYPLLKITDSSLLGTGVAKITGDSISTGIINESFVSCTFEKKDISKQSIIKLDPTKTHIYSLGKSVINIEDSDIDITW